MRKVVLYGFVLVCLTAVSFLGVTPIERRILNPDGTTAPSAPVKAAQQVEVTNFPAVQAVSGNVTVGNLPAVQQVNGTISVDNLPIDGNGHLLVAVQNSGSSALVLHSTAATYQGNLGGRTGATQKCQAEFPGSHFAHRREIDSAIGNLSPSGNIRGVVWLISETEPSWLDDFVNANCGEWQKVTADSGDRIDGPWIRAKGTELFNGGPCSESHPLVCAD